jgi:hypothetical protein
MESQSEQPHLPATPDALRYVQERRLYKGVPIVNENLTCLLRDEEPSRTVTRICDDGGTYDAADHGFQDEIVNRELSLKLVGRREEQADREQSEEPMAGDASTIST